MHFWDRNGTKINKKYPQNGPKMAPQTTQNDPHIDTGCPKANFWTFWGSLGGVLGRPGAVLEASWGVLGGSWGTLAASWARLGASWGGLGRLRGVLEALWRALKKFEHQWFYSVFGHPGSEEDV